MTYRVFISSTGEDLQGPHRDAARKAVDQMDVFKTVMMEDFVASGQAPHPLCMAKVQTCDVLVVIVARRYGWVPDGQQKVSPG